MRLKIIALVFGSAVGAFAAATLLSLKPVTKTFDSVLSSVSSKRVLDKTGAAIALTYRDSWNTEDFTPLYALPDFLVTSFLFSEDRRFYDHHGVDIAARLSALAQNIRNQKSLRGASTITEQIVRILHPRPRNLWSKWVEGIEAARLECHADKTALLEFYLNQIPYAAHRRGVAQAARYYFDRDLTTLSTREMLALVVLARAPSAYDLYNHPERINTPLTRLAHDLHAAGKMRADVFADFQAQSLSVRKPPEPVEARHFARYARLHADGDIVRTTLDPLIQQKLQNLVDARLKKLRDKNVTNAGALVLDHTTGEIVAWVVGGATDKNTKGGDIDTVLTPRQPGSTLKPFLYAMALEKGWTAASILNDAPVAEAVGSGLHRFRNYSNTHYGPLTLREALGNSLNIPAILTIHHVGVAPFLHLLHRLGFNSLDRDASVYDEGLALGNGEVTLFELVRAYAALANKGQTVPLHPQGKSETIFSPEIASLIGDILSDPRARALEFGNDSVLNLPVRTAAKTGTSTDYRDAWTLAYNDRYVVGLWFGNLDRTPMKDVTGSTGPALVMRAIFRTLNEGRDTKPLYISPALLKADICTRPEKSAAGCMPRTEFFIGAVPHEKQNAPTPRRIELVRPTQNLLMAYDPRVPARHQKFRFELAGLSPGESVRWVLDGKLLAEGENPHHLWPLEKGVHSLAVTITGTGKHPQNLPPVEFTVR